MTDTATATTARKTTARKGNGAAPAAPPALSAEGYEVRQAHGAYELLARTDAATGEGPAWLVRCTAHGTLTGAANATTEGRALGKADARAGWCAECKTAADAAPAKAAKPSTPGRMTVSIKLTVELDAAAWVMPAADEADRPNPDDVAAALVAAGFAEDAAREMAERAVPAGAKAPSAADVRADVRRAVTEAAAKGLPEGVTVTLA